MSKLETNLDACRLSSEILQRLRRIVRESLGALHGKGWEEDGIPVEIRDFLMQRQAREASISWNLTDTVDVLDFAGFLNIYEIIAANDSLLQRFLPLAPDPTVLRIRFLELDTVLNRIAYARPITDAELGFLVSFDERLRKTSTAPPSSEEIAAAKARPGRSAPVSVSRDEMAEPVASRQPEARAQSAATAAGRGQAPPPPPPPRAPEPEVVTTAAPPAQPELGPKELEAALKRADDKIIFAALYQEVTALADGLWNAAVHTQQAKAWEKVRESQWYHDRFAKLGLKPISDFFGLFETAREKMQAGTSKSDLQEFLKEHNFVQVLLALKTLFKTQKS